MSDRTTASGLDVETLRRAAAEKDYAKGAQVTDR